MRAPGPSFTDAIAVVCQRHDPEHRASFCAHAPMHPPAARADFRRLRGAGRKPVRGLVFVAVVVAAWGGGSCNNAAVRKRDLIRLLHEVGRGIDSPVRQYLEKRERD